MAARPRTTLDDQARAVLPLTPVVMHILLALVDHDRHGLGIAEHVQQFSAGRVVLGPGTLYGAVKRLLETGLLENREEAPKGESSDPRRRYYRLSPLGRRALELETRELANVIAVARVKRVIP